MLKPLKIKLRDGRHFIGFEEDDLKDKSIRSWVNNNFKKYLIVRQISSFYFGVREGKNEGKSSEIPLLADRYKSREEQYSFILLERSKEKAMKGVFFESLYDE